jgi:Mn-dependent DtxR family transcriptional regulator
VTRAWKGYDWEAMDRLHRKGYIANPRGSARSVAITEKGKVKAKQLFRQLFGFGTAP